MLYLTVFFILLVIYTVLFWIDIKVALDYVRNERDEWVKFSFFTVDRFFRYEYEIPLQKDTNKKVKFKLVKGQRRKTRSDSEKNKKLKPLEIFEKIKNIRSYFNDHASLFEEIKTYLNKKNIHAELRIRLMQGTGDAALTGLLCGLLWAAEGILVSYFSGYLKNFKKEILIIPCFNKKIFDVDAYCIFHVKLVHIIVVLIKIYKVKQQINHKLKKAIGGEVSG